jgi:nucleoside phosphorylase
MKTNFMKSAVPAFGRKPVYNKVSGMVSKAAPLLPAVFQAAYVKPLETHLQSVFSRTNGDPDFIETLTGAVYEHGIKGESLPLHRFLAVISDLYLSFLDESKRAHLDIPLQEVLPPLAVLQSSPDSGPFTVPVDDTGSMLGAKVGVVSIPATFGSHPLLFGSLTHETGGHDVIHADTKLMPQLRAGVYNLFKGQDGAVFGLLWDYWMDEAAADVYGMLNMGPTFASNLAALLAVFIGQMENPHPARPALRTQSGADDSGALDVHPTDILRLALAQGVISALAGLSAPTRNRYIAEIDELAAYLAPGATTVELMGSARVDSGRSNNFNQSFSLSDLRASARAVGAYIATAKFDALAGHSVQDIETWDDADENTAASIATLLRAGKTIVNAGDDAQTIAGLTLAVLDQPQRYAEFSTLANDALDASFLADPYWGVPGPDNFILLPSKKKMPSPGTGEGVDPYAAWIIDFNPLEQDTMAIGGVAPGIVTSHAINAIPWPSGLNPTAVPMSSVPSPSDPLPKADIVLITWTAAEANAMAMSLTPGYIAMPPSHSTKNNGWYPYASKYNSYVPNLSKGSPALEAKNLGKYFFTKIGGQKVLCFKSSLHLARDTKEMPVKDLFKQIAKETGAKLIITTGTAGAIGSRFVLGDAVIATKARFDLMGMFKSEPFNNQTFTSTYKLPSGLAKQMALANSKLIPANVSHLPALPRQPRIYDGTTVLSEPNIIVTTDIFAYDDSTDHYGLQGKGTMVEMDDAVLALACAEMGNSAPDWLAIRNASDPQVGPNLTKADAAKIYADYGYWTTLSSVLGCWSVITG